MRIERLREETERCRQTNTVREKSDIKKGETQKEVVRIEIKREREK